MREFSVSERPQPARAPAWAWVLIGWLLGRAWGARAECGRAPFVPRECTVELEPLPRGIPGLREFRAVPGVGRRRSLTLVQHLWDSGAGLDFGTRDVRWEEVEGIGPVTAAALSRAFPEASARPPESGEGEPACRVPCADGVHSSHTRGHDDDASGTRSAAGRAARVRQ